MRRDSKKTIHNLPCLRYKVTSIVTYRPGGLGLTKRFTHTKVVDVTEYTDNIIYEIQMMQGLCREPVRLQVRRFRAKDTDILDRKYVDNGIPRVQRIEPFCLADVKQTAREFEEYIWRNAIEGLTEAVKDSDGIVREVFAMVARHCAWLNSHPVRILSPMPASGLVVETGSAGSQEGRRRKGNKDQGPERLFAEGSPSMVRHT